MGWSEAGLSCGGCTLVMFFFAASFLISSIDLPPATCCASLIVASALVSSSMANWLVGSRRMTISSSPAAIWASRSSSPVPLAVVAAMRSDLPFSKCTREASSLARCR